MTHTINDIYVDLKTLRDEADLGKRSVMATTKRPYKRSFQESSSHHAPVVQAEVGRSSGLLVLENEHAVE